MTHLYTQPIIFGDNGASSPTETSCIIYSLLYSLPLHTPLTLLSCYSYDEEELDQELDRKETTPTENTLAAPPTSAATPPSTASQPHADEDDNVFEEESTEDRVPRWRSEGVRV